MKDLGVVYDALLSVPTMEDNIKIDLRVSRKQVLLLSRVIEQGLKDAGGSMKELLAVLPQDAVEGIKLISDECLQKAGLTELKAKLQKLES